MCQLRCGNNKILFVVLVVTGVAFRISTRHVTIFPDVAVRYNSGFSDQTDLGLADYIATRWLLAPSNNPLNLKNRKQGDFSQYKQGLFVDRLLRRRTGGFFVECGAATGEELSNTLFFELMRGWTGLLIEADPKQFRELMKKHRRAYLLNACLSDATARIIFHAHGFYGGLDTGYGTPMIVQCFPLYPILRATGRVHVDYLSLDVEGAELSILRTIPFHAVYIDVIGVEYRVNFRNHTRWEDGTMRKLTEIRQFFHSLGTYTEVGILPWGTHVNVDKTEAAGVDVFFKHI